MYMDNEGTTLASEILAELKTSARRWFIAFIIMLAIEVFTVAGFLWYLSLPIEETTTTQTIEDIESGTITQRIGDTVYGTSDTDSN